MNTVQTKLNTSKEEFVRYIKSNLNLIYNDSNYKKNIALITKKYPYESNVDFYNQIFESVMNGSRETIQQWQIHLTKNGLAVFAAKLKGLLNEINRINEEALSKDFVEKARITELNFEFDKNPQSRYQVLSSFPEELVINMIAKIGDSDLRINRILGIGTKHRLRVLENELITTGIKQAVSEFGLPKGFKLSSYSNKHGFDNFLNNILNATYRKKLAVILIDIFDNYQKRYERTKNSIDKYELGGHRELIYNSINELYSENKEEKFAEYRSLLSEFENNYKNIVAANNEYKNFSSKLLDDIYNFDVGELESKVGMNISDIYSTIEYYNPGDLVRLKEFRNIVLTVYGKEELDSFNKLIDDIKEYNKIDETCNIKMKTLKLNYLSDRQRKIDDIKLIERLIRNYRFGDSEDEYIRILKNIYIFDERTLNEFIELITNVDKKTNENFYCETRLRIIEEIKNTISNESVDKYVDLKDVYKQRIQKLSTLKDSKTKEEILKNFESMKNDFPKDEYVQILNILNASSSALSDDVDDWETAADLSESDESDGKIIDDAINFYEIRIEECNKTINLIIDRNVAINNDLELIEKTELPNLLKERVSSFYSKYSLTGNLELTISNIYESTLTLIDKREKKQPNTASDYSRLENDLNNYLSGETGKTDALIGSSFYNWQLNNINNALDGFSSNTIGPTSGGKTHIMKYIVSEFRIGKKTEMLLIFPTDTLAFQFLCDIRALINDIRFTYVTNYLSVISNDPEIWIGTPTDMLVYLETVRFNKEPIKFDTIFFDEIHTISIAHSTDPIHNISAHAMLKLMKWCGKQIITMSATVNIEDVPDLLSSLKENSGVTTMKNFEYTQRSVPLLKQLVSPDGRELKILNITDPIRDIDYDENTPVEFVKVDPINTFKILKNMETSGHQSGIVFDPSDKVCYENFVEYIETIENEAKENSELWIYINKHYGPIIRNTNENKSANIGEKNQKKYMDLQIKYLDEIKSLIDELEDKEKRLMKNGTYPKYTAEILNENGVSRIVSSQVRDLRNEHVRCTKYLIENNGKGSVPCVGIPPYFRIGNIKHESNIIDYLNNVSNNNVENIKNMIAAENLDRDMINDIFKNFKRGHDLGVHVILPTFPFTVIYEQMILLSQRTGCAFSSSLMGAGINFPIKYSIIRNPTLTFKNPSSIMQEFGRAGRMGKDDVGINVVWNISNGLTAGQNTLYRIVFPSQTSGRSYYISDYRSTVEKINVVLETIRFDFEAYQILKDQYEIALRHKPQNLQDRNRIEKLREDLKEKVKDVVFHNLPLKSLMLCITPIINAMQFSDRENWNDGWERAFSKIDGNNVSDLDTYMWLENIKRLNTGIKELHTRYHRLNAPKDSQNYKLLAALKELFRIIQNLQNKILSLVYKN